MLTDKIRQAAAIIRANPEALTELDAEEAAKAAAAKAEAERVAKLTAAVEKALPARVEALVADYVARETQALQDAAERLGRLQLRQEGGLVSPTQVAYSPASVRLTAGHVEAEARRLAASEPVPWHKGRSAVEVRAQQAAAAAAAAAQPPAGPREPLTMEGQAAAARAAAAPELERRNAAAVDARKKAAGIGPYAKPKAGRK